MTELFAGVLAAVAASAALASAAETPAAHPIELIATAEGSGVMLQVVGDSAADLEATYALTVAGGGNRSSQSGRAHLIAGRRVILARLRLGGDGATNWSAVLQVEPKGRPGYQIERDGR